VTQAPADGSLADPNIYATGPNASLASPNELSAVVKSQMQLDGQVLNYTATTGHLSAKDPQSGRSASFFYTAYTRDGSDKATRPVTFLFNGGPGSASMWLHLGSFGPKRIVTNNPSLDVPNPPQLVDNAESLLGVSDLVFVDAVGTGYSQAIAPAINKDFWGVDSDAAGFRDFIRRYLEVNTRQASPLFVYGESYGGPRAAILANLLETAGVRVSGVLLQAPALDYNSNCGMADKLSCAGYMPTYAAIGYYHKVGTSLPSDFSSHIDKARAFAAGSYAAAAQANISAGTPLPQPVLQQIFDYTGISINLLATKALIQPDTVQLNVKPGYMVGRYDARVSAVNGSPLNSGFDPSIAVVGPSFNNTMTTYLPNQLRYTAKTNYASFNSVIQSWNFSHGGRDLPDTIPDLAAALLQNPNMKIMAMSGYYDLATPFHLTETDLARLNRPQNVTIRNYHGGHMSYFDDAARKLQRTDLINFYASAIGAK
jgi:carboxypeptidase C (cathepsin A)